MKLVLDERYQVQSKVAIPLLPLNALNVDSW
jgi:hypothetical protein